MPFAAFLSIVLGIFIGSAFAETNNSGVWRTKSEGDIASRGNRLIIPDNYLVYELNRTALRRVLAQSPLEFSDEARNRENIIEIPTPDGKLERFKILETALLVAHVDAEFPDWKYFQAYGIDDPTATARFGITLLGFHATVFSTRGTYQIDPYQRGDVDNYITYFKRDVQRTTNFHCDLDEKMHEAETPTTFSAHPNFRTVRRFAHIVWQSPQRANIRLFSAVKRLV